MKYLLAHDFGTSGLKSSLFTTEGDFIATHTEAYPTFYSNGSWVEQDPEDWWKAFCVNNKLLLKDIVLEDVIAVGFDGTNPNCTCIGVDNRPLRNCIIWQDARAVEENDWLSGALPEKYTASRPNHKLGTDRSICKLLWVKNHQPEIFEKTKKVLPCVQDYIILKLTGRACTCDEVAGSSAFMNVEKTDWSQEVLSIAGIPMSLMPEIHKRTDVVGEIDARFSEECGLAAGTKLVMGSGDTQCMNVGVHMFKPGDGYLNGGTSAGVIAWSDKMTKLGGQTASSGSSLSWLKNTICLHEQDLEKEIGKDVYSILNEEALKSPVGCNGVMFHPYLAGERAPRNNPLARGSFTGISLTTTRADLIRSVIEGIGLNVNLILKGIREQGYPLKRIPFVGGMGRGEITRQILADIMDVEFIIYDHIDEAATAGVAVLTGMAIGIFEDEIAVEKFMKPVEIVKPNKENHKEYEKLMPKFEAIYNALVPV